MMSVFLVVLGIVGVRRLGTDLFPDVSFPFVTITCVYPGAGPSEIVATMARSFRSRTEMESSNVLAM